MRHLTRLACFVAAAAVVSTSTTLSSCGVLDFEKKKAVAHGGKAEPAAPAKIMPGADPRGSLVLKWVHADVVSAFVVARIPKGTRTPEMFARIALGSEELVRDGSAWHYVVNGSASKKLASGDCLTVAAEASDGVLSPPSTIDCIDAD